MSAASKANASLPIMKGDELRCIICTKSSKFSDISHLLTHISSKQHLANNFKVRIAAAQDENAQAQLDQFKTWFDRWDLAALLRERQQQKENKKNGVRKATGMDKIALFVSSC